MTRFNRRSHAVVIGMEPWKHLLEIWLREHSVRRLTAKTNFFILCSRLVVEFFRFRNSTVYAWGYKHPLFADVICRALGMPFVRIEDGFLRSIALGATGTPPISLCFDKKSMYYNASIPSDLETIIQTYNFDQDRVVIERAKRGIDALRDLGISKYNTGRDTNIKLIYGKKKRKRVLVIGQVDRDMSIRKGCECNMTSNELVRLAHKENPGAQIIYRPHPEILRSTRFNNENFKGVADIAFILAEDVRLSDAFETIDHVYTITSLAGFEALMRGIPVTCIGAPFYAGWGLTDDRQATPKRTARRDIWELFAAAYLIYPRYFDPQEASEIAFEDAVALLFKLRGSASSKDT